MYELSKKDRKAISFTVTSKIKYIGINLTKKMKDLYTKSYKNMMKEIEEDTNNQKDTNS